MDGQSARSDVLVKPVLLMRYLKHSALFLLIFLVAGCGDGQNDVAAETPAAMEQPGEVATTGSWDSRLSQDEIDSGRRDGAWRNVVQLDTVGFSADTAGNPEEWDQISPETVNQDPMHLPLYGDVAGPSVLRTQILLDRVLFSPGIIDGAWGKNTEKAIYWFQTREGLRRSGRVDRDTFDRLVELSGAASELIVSHTLTADEVEGPFVEIPEDIYDKAELDCMCYESLTEKLAETFHTSPDILAQLNPDVDLDALSAGDQIEVPNIRDANAGQNEQVARLEISADGFYVHALDSSGRIVFHFPSVLGSSYDPSPTGNHSIASITLDPWWHYQPDLLESVPDDEPDARIPPGPNNAVGAVWMALSIEHYGIHGTSAPETIGYTTSAGCVRLTNWDALFLADRVNEGTPVEFTAGGSSSAAEGA